MRKKNEMYRVIHNFEIISPSWFCSFVDYCRIGSELEDENRISKLNMNENVHNNIYL